MLDEKGERKTAASARLFIWQDVSQVTRVGLGEARGTHTRLFLVGEGETAGDGVAEGECEFGRVEENREFEGLRLFSRVSHSAEEEEEDEGEEGEGEEEGEDEEEEEEERESKMAGIRLGECRKERTGGVNEEEEEEDEGEEDEGEGEEEEEGEDEEEGE